MDQATTPGGRLAPITPFPSSGAHEPRSQVQAWLGQPPTQAFWASLREAQQSVTPMVKGEEFPDKKGKHFSRTEDWIKEGRKYLLDRGLMGSQLGATFDDGANGPVLSTQFLVVNTVDGTGLLCTVEWPVYGFGGGKGSPGHGTAAAFTGTWKYWLRGLLAIPQVDEGEEFEARDGSVHGWDERRANEQRGSAAAAGMKKPAHQPQAQTQQHERFHQPPPDNNFQPSYDQGPPQGYQQPLYDQQQEQRPYPPLRMPGQEWQQQPWTPPNSYPAASSYQRPEYGHGTQLPPQRQVPTNEAYQQAQRPPVHQEPIVQYAQRALGSEPVPFTNPNPPTREAPRDGGPDHTFDELARMGWQEIFARHLAAIGPNEEIPDALRTEFLNSVMAFFDGNNDLAMAGWAGTNFTPAGPKGPRPTGAHLRRYAVKIDWHKKAAASAAGR